MTEDQQPAEGAAPPPAERPQLPPSAYRGSRGHGRAQRQATQRLQVERRKRVAELMLQRYTASEIAQQLGLHRNTIQRDAAAVRRQWIEETTHKHGEWVAQELRALDQDERRLLGLFARAQQQAEKLTGTAATEEGRDSAVAAAQVYDRILKVKERRARLLGLDEPERVETRAAVHATVDMVGEARAVLADQRAVELVMQLQDMIAGALPAPPRPAPLPEQEPERRALSDAGDTVPAPGP